MPDDSADSDDRSRRSHHSYYISAWLTVYANILTRVVARRVQVKGFLKSKLVLSLRHKFILKPH